MSNWKLIDTASAILTVASIGVAIGGVVVSSYSLASVKSWEGRYYEASEKLEAAKEEIKKLNQQLLQTNGGTTKMVFAVTSDDTSKQTLARKNRNLLNIRKLSNGGKWEGQIGVDKDNHVIFEHPAYSVRAGVLILKAYERKHKIDTVEKLISRFCEGNRDEYIKHLCRALGVKRNTKISLIANLHKLIPAMIYFETGEKIGSEYISIIEAVKG